MTVRLITYDLNDPGQNHQEVLEKIRTYDWTFLSESSYAVNTQETPEDIHDAFKPILDDSDTFLVLTLTRPYAGRAHPQVLDWLQGVL